MNMEREEPPGETGVPVATGAKIYSSLMYFSSTDRIANGAHRRIFSVGPVSQPRRVTNAPSSTSRQGLSTVVRGARPVISRPTAERDRRSRSCVDDTSLSLTLDLTSDTAHSCAHFSGPAPGAVVVHALNRTALPKSKFNTALYHFNHLQLYVYAIANTSHMHMHSPHCRHHKDTIITDAP